MSRKGRVVEIASEPFKSCAVTQGVKKENQGYYDNSDNYAGSNGTYYHDFHSEPHVVMKVVAYESEEYDQQLVEFEIRDLLLQQHPDWKIISAQRLASLKEKLEHEKIDLVYDKCTNSIGFDPSILL